MPRVSVVVPIHNRAHLLGETLESVIRQTYPDWECIVVDDHSTDNALEIAAQYAGIDPRIRVVALPNQKHSGNAARNYGLELALGKYVNFLDSDDLITRNKIEIQTKILDSDCSLEMVTCRYARFREDPARDSFQVKFAPPESWLDAIWAPMFTEGGLWQTGCPLWRVEAVRRIGGWNESIQRLQDTELHLRAMLQGVRIGTVDQILIFLRTGNEQLSSPKAENCPQITDTLLTAWRELEDAHEVTELRRKLISLRFYRCARRYLDENKMFQGMSTWLKGSRAIGQGWYRTVIGFLVLLTGHFTLLSTIHRWLRPAFVSSVNELPASLPDLDRIPWEWLITEACRFLS